LHPRKKSLDEEKPENLAVQRREGFGKQKKVQKDIEREKRGCWATQEQEASE